MKEQRLLKKGFSSSIYNYIGRISANAFIFLTSVFIIKFLSVEEYGVYNILTAVLTVALTLHLGIPKIVNRYIPEYFEKKNWFILRKLTYWSLALRFLTGLCFALALVLFRNFFITLFKFPANLTHYLFLFILVLIVKVESNLLEYIMDSLLDYKYKSIYTIIYAVFRFFAFYYLLSQGYGLVGIIWGWLIVEVLLFILYAYRNTRQLLPEFSKVKKKDDSERYIPVRRFARYGGFYFISGIGGYVLNYQTDNFFISAFLDNVQVGLYSFGARIVALATHVNPVLLLQGIVSTVLIRKYSKDNDKNQLLYAFRLYNKLIFFLGFPMFIGLCLLADKVVLYIFNKPEYLEALPVLWGWVFITMFTLLLMVIYPLIRVLERTEIMMYSLMFPIVNIGLDLVLIPKLGIKGALLATGSARIMAFYFHLFMLRRYLPVKYPWIAFIRIGLNIGAMGLLVFLLRHFIDNLFSLILVSLAGALFYFIISFFNKGFSYNDRKVLNAAIGKKLFIF